MGFLGQPSDSSGGTCKRSMMDLTKAGQCEFFNTNIVLLCDIISEVEMDREMRLSKKIVDEILSIYM